MAIAIFACILPLEAQEMGWVMVWQYILPGVAALAVVVGGVIAANWEEIEKALKGKNLAVLGPRGAGKTTLIKFLLKGELSKEYIVTSKPEQFSGKKLALGELELVINDITDVPGDIGSHDEWERLCHAADVVCYLIDVSRVHIDDKDYEKTIKGDMRHIGEWLNEPKSSRPKVFLVATHCDLIPEYVALSDAGETGFTDALWKTDLMQNLILYGGGVKHVKCVAGSLLGREKIEKLVGNILRQVIT